ncbi:hypothetical protein YC2023_091089 [Brassica napus]
MLDLGCFRLDRFPSTFREGLLESHIVWDDGPWAIYKCMVSLRITSLDPMLPDINLSCIFTPVRTYFAYDSREAISVVGRNLSPLERLTNSFFLMGNSFSASPRHFRTGDL